MSSTSYSSYLSTNTSSRGRFYQPSRRSQGSRVRSNICYIEYILILASSSNLYTYREITLVILRLPSFLVSSFLLSLLIQIFFVFRNTLLSSLNISTRVLLLSTPFYQYYQALIILLLTCFQIFLISLVLPSQSILLESSREVLD